MSQALDILTVPAASPSPHGADDARLRLADAARAARELASAEGAAEELVLILRDLGPVFAGFARFLASRADVVPAGLRADLAMVPDLVEPAPASEVRAVVEAGWKARIEDVCATFEEHPVETRFPTQSHRAWLTPTDAVIVSCVPASFAARAEREATTLTLLSPALAAPLGGPEAFEALVADYRALLARRLDFSDDITASEALVADARRFPPLLARRPHPGLSSRCVAVWDAIAPVSPDTPGFDSHEAGPSVCRAWLRQALLGRAFPEEPAPADFIVAGRRQVALAGRLFTTLPSDAQLTVQGYLVAVAAGDPDLAIRFLMRELVAGRAADATGFERRIRHAWSVDADAAGGSELMAQLLLHWRIAVEHGYQPKARLASFYRGCLAAVSAATAMGAEADVLRDSLEALQLRLMAFQVEAVTGVSPSTARSVREAGWRFVTTLASGPIASDRAGAGGPGAPMFVVGSLALSLLAIGVAMPSLIASGATWADPVGAAVFAAVGVVAIGMILFRRPAP